MNDAITARIIELQAERQQLIERLQQLAAETEQTRHLISAYDGAIGELGRLAEQTRPVDGLSPAEESPEPAG